MNRLLTLITLWSLNALVLAAEPVRIGSRRELLVDEGLVERMAGRAELRLHAPTPREVAFETNEAWEGNSTNYVTVFQDGDKYRMYYRGSHFSYLGGKDRPNTRDVYCYAESSDGIRWTKPELALFDWNGSKQNNIVWDGVGSHAFVPFRDTNPHCSADAKYKALGVGGKTHGLYAFKSADAIHWELMHPEPVITKGAFDSQNLAFWDSERGEYREYHRDFREGRDIRTSSSQDFRKWTEPEFLSYSAIVDPGRRDERNPADVKDPVAEKYPSGRVSELYTNQIAPYYRAPHLLLGFPTRYIDRGWTESVKALPRYEYRQARAKDSRREGTALTDGMFMVSRDREQFSVWPESFLRPGLRTRDSWFYGDAYQNWGLVETRPDIDDAPPELSLYVTERTMQETGGVLRRYSLRIDGFVSLHAPLVGGELVTRPLTFTGNQLSLNVSTSAAGSVRVEIQDAGGQLLPGFAMADCQDVYGDDLDRTVVWSGNSDLAKLAGVPVRLRIEVKDADLYSFQFCTRP
ncbi:MAG: glycoside hydrolase family 32 protein [Planctomycetes bacterium]|nr:glycoside hydrolase family 32 protein [Planctomycetota bacterium]